MQPLEVHSNFGTQAAEEHAARLQYSPQLRQHRAEVPVIASKVKHGIAEHHIRKPVGKRHIVERAHLEVLREQSGLKRGGQLADVLHARGILVDREDLATFAQQVNEVAPVSASGVKHAHAGLNVAAQDLIEDIDIDLAELLLNAQGHSTTTHQDHCSVCTESAGSSTSSVFDPRSNCTRFS